MSTSVERLGAALQESGDPRSDIRVYPNLEHMLNVIPTGVTGLSAEEVMYSFHGFRFGPGVKADLTTWLSNLIGSGRL